MASKAVQPSSTGCWPVDQAHQMLYDCVGASHGDKAACEVRDDEWRHTKGEKRQRPSCDTKCTATAPASKFASTSNGCSPACGQPCNSDCSEASMYDQHMMMCEEEPAYTCAMQQDTCAMHQDCGPDTGSDLCCSTGTTSIMGVHMPEGGWFAKCRGCGWMTSHELGVCDVEMPLCKRCQQSLQSASCEVLQSRMVATLLYVHHAWADAGL